MTKHSPRRRRGATPPAAPPAVPPCTVSVDHVVHATAPGWDVRVAEDYGPTFLHVTVAQWDQTHDREGLILPLRVADGRWAVTLRTTGDLRALGAALAAAADTLDARRAG